MKKFIKFYFKSFFKDIAKILVVTAVIAAIGAIVTWLFFGLDFVKTLRLLLWITLGFFIVVDYLLIPVKKWMADYIAQKKGLKPEEVYEMIYVHKFKAKDIENGDKDKLLMKLTIARAIDRL